MTAAPTVRVASSLERELEEARRRIEVLMPELEEARHRRDALATALRTEFPGSRTYVNGSVAHGDALTPLTDVDLGVVVPNPKGEYGPVGKGPTELKDRAADAIRARLKNAYPKLRVELEGHKRSILVRFGDPVTPGQQDFTADVIVAIDNPTGQGLYIPRYDSWDRSHPEEHTRLIRAANLATDVMYSRIVRLTKHWARRHDRPLCSWHIKALALGCLLDPTTLLTGLHTWFTHGIDELSRGDTLDPAGVATHPIKSSMPRTKLVAHLIKARERLEHAIALDEAGWDILALDELAKFFNDEDMLPRPDQRRVIAQEAARRTRSFKSTSSSLIRGTGEGDRRTHTAVRSWAP